MDDLPEVTPYDNLRYELQELNGLLDKKQSFPSRVPRRFRSSHKARLSHASAARGPRETDPASAAKGKGALAHADRGNKCFT